MSETEKSVFDETTFQAGGSIAGTLTAGTTAADTSVAAFRVSISSSAMVVKAIYDPVAIELAQAYKELNEAVRAGYSVPTSSTK